MSVAPGLSSQTAAALLAAEGPNELPSARPRTLLDVAVEVVREPMLLLLIATGSVYLLIGDLEEAIALVIRDGVATRIPGRDVVRGDRVILREGDRVPADGAVESSANLAVDESLLTGESAPVVKQSERGVGGRESPRPGAAAHGRPRSHLRSGTSIGACATADSRLRRGSGAAVRS